MIYEIVNSVMSYEQLHSDWFYEVDEFFNIFLPLKIHLSIGREMRGRGPADGPQRANVFAEGGGGELMVGAVAGSGPCRRTPEGCSPVSPKKGKGHFIKRVTRHRQNCADGEMLLRISIEI